MNKSACFDYTIIVLVCIVCLTCLAAYYFYIDSQIKMLVKEPQTKNKITIRILALGFAMGYSVLLLPFSKDSLDFQFYGLKIELYAVTKAIFLLASLGFGSITGGTGLSTLIKGRTDE